MKRLIILAFINLLLPFLAQAGWEKTGNIEKLSVSDSAKVVQYVFSKDGKNIYILDSWDYLHKFDAATGNKAWDRKIIHSYRTRHPRISMEADVYSMDSSSDYNSPYFIYIKDIETDSIKNKYRLYYTHDIFLTDKNLFLLSGEESKFENSQAYQCSAEGITKILKREKDTLLPITDIDSLMGRIDFTDFDNSGTKLFGYFYYYNFYVYYGEVQESVDFQRLLYYDLKENKLKPLFSHENSDLRYSFSVYKMVKNVRLSGSGNLAFAIVSLIKGIDSLYAYNTDAGVKINSCYINNIISSMACSNDDKYLLLASNKSIKIIRAQELGELSDMEFPALPDTIKMATFSPDDQFVYFASGGNIYKFMPDVKDTSLKVFFYTDKDTTYATDKIHFYNGSGGNPDSCLWNFGDGATSIEVNPVHAYSDTGYYDVKLTCFKGDKKESLVIKKDIYILPLLKSNFDYSKYESECPVRVQFVNKSQGKIDSVKWFFDDGSVSSDFSPEHEYSFSGTYNVKLTIYSQSLKMDTTVAISINYPYIPVDKSEYEYELTYSADSVSEAVQGYETRDSSIIFNKKIDSYSYSIVSMQRDSTINWKNDIHPYYYYLKKNETYLAGTTFSDNLVHNDSLNTSLILRDESGKVINQYYNNRKINNFRFDKDGISLTYSFYPGYPSYWKTNFYLARFDKNLNKIDEVLVDSLIIDKEIKDEWQRLNYTIIRTGNKIDVVICYGYDQDNADHYKSSKYYAYRINGKTMFPKNGEYLSFIDVIRLNPDLLVVCFDDGNILLFEKDKTINPGANIAIKKLFKLNDSTFIAAGSINGQPGYLIYNDNGDILDSIALPCRYGCFNHVSITPDTNLLFSGYVYKDLSFKKQSYFIKTASKKISSYISPELMSSDKDAESQIAELLITPNPTTGEILIKGRDLKNGQLKIEILDIFGSVIEKAYDGDYNGGDLKFDLADLTKGVYFIKLNINGDLKICKMVKI